MAAPAPVTPLATDVIPAEVSAAPGSTTDHLLIPQLYGPTYTAAGRAAAFLGGVLSGGDRMEIHRWTLAGYFQLGLDAGSGPIRSSIEGSTLRPPAARCRTTKTEAGSSGGMCSTT